MASGNYVPISCDDHDILELAIMGGEKLRVRFVGEQDSHLITPLELSARDGEEFLRYRGTGGVHEIRLDKMKEFRRELVPIKRLKLFLLHQYPLNVSLPMRPDAYRSGHWQRAVNNQLPRRP